MSIRQRLVIAGKVQQVGFRDFAVRAAQGLGVTGWVRNLRDGTVEVVVSGEEDAVATMVEACRTGPPNARVDHVEAHVEPGPPVRGFTKRFTH